MEDEINTLRAQIKVLEDRERTVGSSKELDSRITIEKQRLYFLEQRGSATFEVSVLKERIDALAVEVNATRIELDATKTQLNTQLSLSRDPRLFYFSTVMPGSKGSHSTVSRQIKSLYGPQCMFCGSNEGVTLAHLVAGNPAVDYSPFGPPKYRPDFDYRSVRNFILLCGTRGEEGTCHNEFDNYLIGMVPEPLGEGGNRCTLLCLRHDFAKYEELNNKSILVRDPHPYRRLLAWRNRKCLLEHGRLCSGDVIQNALRACDLSEIANSVDNSDSDSDDADTDSAGGDDVAVDNVGGDTVDADEVNSDVAPVKSVS